MKKLYLLGMALTVLFTLAACAGQKEAGNGPGRGRGGANACLWQQ